MMHDHLIETVRDILDNTPEEEQEDAAIYLWVNLSNRFGWAGTFLTREDVQAQVGRPLTEDEWSRLQGHKAWNDMGSTWTEHGMWDDIDFALTVAEIPYAEDDDIQERN